MNEAWFAGAPGLSAAVCAADLDTVFGTGFGKEELCLGRKEVLKS